MDNVVRSFAIPGLLIIALFALSRRVRHRAKTRLPPGPLGLPVLGNIRDLPAPHEYPYLKFSKLCRDYGESLPPTHREERVLSRSHSNYRNRYSASESARS